MNNVDIHSSLQRGFNAMVTRYTEAIVTMIGTFTNK